MIPIGIALVLIFAAVAPPGSDLTAIQDNSFLAEEAYNQEKGVVQHINLFTRDGIGDVAMPIGIGPSAGSQSIVAYLSFEHRFVR